jgi:HEPN domain-containing protein
MAEGLSVEPHWVSGYGILLTAESTNIRDIHGYTGANAGPHTPAYTGLLSSLETPVNMYTNGLLGRLSTRLANTSRTGTELQRAAWEYLDKEDENTRTFQGELEVDADEDAEEFSASAPDLPDLDVPEPDYSDLFHEVSSLVGGIDWFLAEQLGWSPYRDVITQLAGNWKALDVEGDALIAIGDATDGVTASIADGWSKLDEHWNGGAAQNCGSYISALTGILGMEGPLNRTVGDLYKLIAAEAEAAVLEVARSLKLPTEDIAIEFGAYGVCAVDPPSEDALETAKDILAQAKYLYEYAQNLVNAITNIIDTAKEFLATLETVGQISSLDSETIQALSTMSNHVSDEQIEEFENTIGNLTDLAALAETDNWENAPTDGFEVGDAERDGA